jgi:predicted  nucleic acid-binding Zn-ribbon protein
MSGSISRNINGGFSISSGLSVSGAIAVTDLNITGSADTPSFTALASNVSTLTANVTSINSRLQTAEAELANIIIPDDINNIVGDVSNLTISVASNYSTLSNSIATTNTNLNTLNSSLATEVDTRESEITRLDDDIGALSTTVSSNYSTLNSTIQSTNANVSVLSSTVSNNYANLNTAIQSTNSNVSGIDTRLTQAELSLSTAVAELANIDIPTDIITLQSNIAVLKTDVIGLEGSVSTLNTDVDQLQSQVGNLNLSNIVSQINTLETSTTSSINDINSSIANLTVQTGDNLQSSLSNINANISTLTTNLNNEITTRTANIATLTSSLSGKQNTITTSSNIDVGTLHCTTALLIDQGTNLQNGVAFNNGTIQWNQQTNSGSHFESTAASSGSNKLISSGAVYNGLATKQNTITASTGIACGAITATQGVNLNAGANISGNLRLDVSNITGNAIDSVALTNQEAKIPTSYTVWTEIQKYTPTTTFNSTVSSINSNVSTLTTNLNNEITTREANIATITTNLNNEITTRTANVASLTTLIGTKAPLETPVIQNSLTVSDGFNTLTLTPSEIIFSDVANSSINTTPSSTIDSVVTQNSTNVVSSGAVYTALAVKAPLASPTFTGTVSCSALTVNGVSVTGGGSSFTPTQATFGWNAQTNNMNYSFLGGTGWNTLKFTTTGFNNISGLTYDNAGEFSLPSGTYLINWMAQYSSNDQGRYLGFQHGTSASPSSNTGLMQYFQTNPNQHHGFSYVFIFNTTTSFRMWTGGNNVSNTLVVRNNNLTFTKIA